MEKRWASRSLVNMLIAEMKDYKSASEVVSGSENVFSLCSRQIIEAIAALAEEPTAEHSLKLQQILDETSQEVREYRRWQTEILSNLPQEDEQRGLDIPLRQAYASASVVCDKLADNVAAAYRKYLNTEISL